jgi:hypothetical protein
MRMTPSSAFSALSILTLSMIGSSMAWATEEATSVPDGGSMALLLGVALLGLAGLRKVFRGK